MPSYDGLNYDPAAPVAEVMLRDPDSGALSQKIRVLVDTGADITLLPRSAVETLGVKIPDAEVYQLQGFDGRTTQARAASLDMIFLNRAYRGRYLLIDENEGILGRDVLASVVILLDGPRQQWSEIRS